MSAMSADRKDLPHVRFEPFEPCGAVDIPPSKSDVHRAVICAALARGKSRLAPVALSDDIKATIGCVKALGARVSLDGAVLTVDGTDIFGADSADGLVLDCGESGSTLRFMIPVAAAGGTNAEFVGRGRLPQRPIGVFAEALPKAGVRCVTEGGLPLKISGRLQGGRFEIPGNISSQFITGLMLALPLLEDDSDIVLTSKAESVGYINMTVKTMARFGVEVEKTASGWHIRGRQSYKPTDYKTDGDWSQAAFFMTAAAISGSVEVRGLNPESAQGDKKIAEIISAFGARVTQAESGIRVVHAPMHALTIDASQIPDLVPALSICACFADGTTEIINAQRLRIKECDRLSATAKLIGDLGGKAEELPDGLKITGVGKLSGGFADGMNDHRIVMSAGAAAAGLEGAVEITCALSVNKSYPDFYKDYNGIGGNANVLDIR